MKFAHLHRPRQVRARRIEIESLESRLQMSVSLQVGDFDHNGTTDLRITGNSNARIVTITDNSAANTTTVTVDATGNGSLTDQGDINRTFHNQFETVDVMLTGSTTHTLNYNVTSNYTNVKKTLLVDLGSGTNTFNFNAGNASMTQSQLTLDVTGTGRDRETATFGALNSVMLVSRAGQTSGTLNTVYNLNGDLSNFTDAAFANDVKSGTNSAVINDRGAVLHTADVEFDYAGGTGADTVTQNWGNSIAGFVLDTVSLGDGANRFTDRFINSFAETATGHYNVNADAGDGRDVMSVTHSTADSINNGIAGVFDFGLSGGGGNDTIRADFATSPIVMETGGILCLHTSGDDGNDTLRSDVTASSLSTGGDFNINIRGADGNDSLRPALTDNSGGKVTQNPGGFALVDGGSGTNTATVSGNLVARKVNIG